MAKKVASFFNEYNDETFDINGGVFSMKHTSDGWWTREKSYGAGKVSVSLQKIPALHSCFSIFTDWWRAFEYNLTLDSKPLSYPRWTAVSSHLRYQKKGLREFVFCRTYLVERRHQVRIQSPSNKPPAWPDACAQPDTVESLVITHEYILLSLCYIHSIICGLAILSFALISCLLWFQV